jgi:hypothetical protein
VARAGALRSGVPRDTNTRFDAGNAETAAD